MTMRMEWEDRQRTRDARHNGWFRRRGDLFYGEQPTLLDVGGTGVVARWDEDLPSSDDGQERLHVALEGRPVRYRHDGSLWRLGGSLYGRRPLEPTDQFPGGPTLHDGRTLRVGIRTYGQDRASEEFQHGLALRWAESVPGRPAWVSPPTPRRRWIGLAAQRAHPACPKVHLRRAATSRRCTPAPLVGAPLRRQDPAA